MMRWLPGIVSLLGILALTTTILWFALLVLSLQPGFADLAEWLYGLETPRQRYLLVAVPYVLLMLYLFARFKAGSALLKAGHVDEAMRWAEPRRSHSLLRSRREALENALVYGKGLIIRQEYEAALEALGQAPRASSDRLTAGYLQLECHLRLDDEARAQELAEALKDAKGPTTSKARFFAACAELAARQDDEDKAQSALRKARFFDRREPRVRWAEMFVDQHWSRPSEPDLVEDSLIPGAAAELLLLAAHHEPDSELTSQLRERALEAPADARSQRLLDAWSPAPAAEEQP